MGERAGETEELETLLGIATYLILDKLDGIHHQVNRMENRIMATLDDLTAALDSQRTSLDNLTTLEAAEAAGGVQPGQTVVSQATLDAAAQKIADNQAEIDALIAADTTAPPPAP